MMEKMDIGHTVGGFNVDTSTHPFVIIVEMCSSIEEYSFLFVTKM